MNTVIVAFAGPIGSGKTSVSAAVADKLAVPRASFGDYVRQLAARLGLDATVRGVLQDVGELMAQYPDEFVAGLLHENAWMPGTPLVVDGVRHLAVLEALRRKAGAIPVVLVYLRADVETRGLRVVRRDGRPPDVQVEAHSTERDVGRHLQVAADLVAFNDGSMSIDTVALEIVVALSEAFTHTA